MKLMGLNVVLSEAVPPDQVWLVPGLEPRLPDETEQEYLERHAKKTVRIVGVSATRPDGG